MSRRGELHIFSTSFIDMICVALCSQIIIWVIAADAGAPEKPVKLEKRIRFFEMTQFGRDHICPDLGSNVSDQGGIPAPVHGDAFPKGTNLSLKNEDDQSAPGIIIKGLAGEEGKFAGGVRIVASEGSQDFSIDFSIGACEQQNEIHYIRCESSYLGEKEPRRFYFLCEKNPIVTKVPKPENKFFVPDKDLFMHSVHKIPASGTLRVTVGKRGRISVECLAEDVPATEALRTQLQAMPDFE